MPVATESWKKLRAVLTRIVRFSLLEGVIAYARAGDVFVVWRLDRFKRHSRHDRRRDQPRFP
jgi:hypothetical protein